MLSVWPPSPEGHGFLPLHRLGAPARPCTRCGEPHTWDFITAGEGGGSPVTTASLMATQEPGATPQLAWRDPRGGLSEDLTHPENGQAACSQATGHVTPREAISRMSPAIRSARDCFGRPQIPPPPTALLRCPRVSQGPLGMKPAGARRTPVFASLTKLQKQTGRASSQSEAALSRTGLGGGTQQPDLHVPHTPSLLPVLGRGGAGLTGSHTDPPPSPAPATRGAASWKPWRVEGIPRIYAGSPRTRATGSPPVRRKADRISAFNISGSLLL